ncbi:MFS transporter [candidate division KSB1 bacterium]|nr:MFS transporter [Phycisphaerae bacterium]NIQ74838.1 MFS transporter [Gammaproteobacteria bacterium]NIV95736.1 MFS transporter [candidate division KSB1 bacterium]NIX30762.1 MFS transporter [Phycisphaerae bacterium]
MKQAKLKPMYRYLMVLTISSTVGLQAWRTLFNNFAVEVAGLEGSHIGMIQSVRELPGLLALLAVFVMIFIREYRLSAWSIFILGLGVAATGLFPSYIGLLLTTLVMSFGFHYFETTNQSLTLQYFDENTSPWVLGKLRSYGAASNIAVGVFIYILAAFLKYTQMYLLIGGLIIAASIWGFNQDPTDRDIIPQRKKMVFRKKYWLFYFLTFMGGARRQIFVAFAVFLLVKKFQFTIQQVTILFVINNTINYFLSPIIGKSIIRFGERKVLSLEYFSLIFIFLAYATVQSKAVLALLYILDHIFFNFAIAIRTYFQKVADPRDIAPSMAMGFTINHIAAVVLPAVGGLLWMVDYRIPFVAGAAFSLVSLIAVQQIRVQAQK